MYVSSGLRLEIMTNHFMRCVVIITTQISVIAGDVLVLGLIWAKTFRDWQESRQLLNLMPLTVTSLLLRDGKCCIATVVSKLIH